MQGISVRITKGHIFFLLQDIVCKGVWTSAANNRNVFVLKVIHFVIFTQPPPPPPILKF